MYFVILVFVLFIDDCCEWGWWLRGFAEVAFGFGFGVLDFGLFVVWVWCLVFGWFLLICFFRLEWVFECCVLVFALDAFGWI